MAVSRLTQTTLQNGFEKFNQLWDGRSAVGSMEPISAITLSAAQSSVEFNNIPGTYSHLQIRGIVRTTRAAGGNDYVAIKFNSDSGGNYAYHRLHGQGATTVVSQATTSTTNIFAGNAPRDQVTASVYGANVFDILDYANTNKYKTVRTLGGADANGSGQITFSSALWMSTSAITSITLSPESDSWKEYSSFTLYGIK